MIVTDNTIPIRLRTRAFGLLSGNERTQALDVVADGDAEGIPFWL